MQVVHLGNDSGKHKQGSRGKMARNGWGHIESNKQANVELGVVFTGGLWGIL